MSSIYSSGINEVMQLLPMSLRNILVKMTTDQQKSIKELRLRAEKPIVAVTQKGSAFVSQSGKLSYIISDSLPKITCDELSQTVKRICGFSVYSHQSEINSGFVTVRGGHRVGMCGTAVTENGKIISVRDISSINIRIADERLGCANEIMSKLFYNGLSNVIIAGAPMSGKTTVLRDLIRQISNGNAGEYYKCAVIDERCEICGTNGLVYENDVGENTDVLNNYIKEEGISQAVRTLSPDIIFCDETASDEEADRILNGIMCGVHFAVTVHAGSIDDLYKRSVTAKLIDSKLFDSVVMLGTGNDVGKIKRIYKVGEQNDKIDGNNNDFGYFDNDREYPRQKNA